MTNHAIGIDLGGTQIKAVVVTAAGEIVQREVRSTGHPESSSFAEVIRDLADSLGREFRVGLSAPGLAARDGRSIASMPGRLEGLAGLDWTAFLARDTPVPVTNDGQAALLGEAWLGAARKFRDVILITLGTGVGGAILSDGRLLRGHLGRAGHLGHLCLDLDGPPSITGMPGALEDWIGNHNISDRTQGRFTTTHALIKAYGTGDPYAQTVWLRSIRALACAIGSLANVIDPEAVIIGGGIAQAGEALFAPLAAELARIEWRPTGGSLKILPAALGEWAGAIGAARTVI